MADWIPGISQLKSVVQLTCGDEEGAKQTQVNFSKQCPGVSQLRSAVEALNGDEQSARETQIEFLGTLSGVANGIPGVGHAKGLVHYACGDKDGGTEAMKAATRTIGVVGAGIAGFAAGGPPGAIAAGTAGGAVMDLATTGLMSAIHDEYNPSGIIKTMSDIKEDPTNAGKWFDAGFTLIADGATGYAAGQMTENFMQKRAAKRAVQRAKESASKTRQIDIKTKLRNVRKRPEIRVDTRTGTITNADTLSVNEVYHHTRIEIPIVDPKPVPSPPACPPCPCPEVIAGVGIGVVVGAGGAMSNRKVIHHNTTNNNIRIENLHLHRPTRTNKKRQEKKIVESVSVSTDSGVEEGEDIGCSESEIIRKTSKK